MMSHDIPPGTQPLESPLKKLEQSLIEDYLRTRGFDPHTVNELPQPQRDALLKDASVHASARLSEVEARSHLVEGMREGHPGAAKAGLE